MSNASLAKNIRYAKNEKCNVCAKQAVVFVGLNDPDGTDYPKCRKHADHWFMSVMLDVQSLKDK